MGPFWEGFSHSHPGAGVPDLEAYNPSAPATGVPKGVCQVTEWLSKSLCPAPHHTHVHPSGMAEA
jgi:hypothetical protein